ncbi:A24 family peptidase [Microbacterium sp. SSW1-59]|uniref:A24 family peptidase n=1 Tax=Microbacterium xanthum TaxID=3079794 RepID=UPI002AD33F55|nr:A24 family peptidase [Microbacterium sp. SSW1-59]MDZ8202677.1 A24 family peptidase [Microbacterium sp. SSW1-59]
MEGDTAQTIAHVAIAAAYASFGGVSVTLAIIDARTHRLPNRIVGSGYGAAGVALLVAGIAGGDSAPLLRAVGAGLVLFAALLVVRVISPHAIGGGDVKLAGLIGIHLGWLGWDAVLVGVLLAFAGAGLFAAVLVIVRRAGGKTRIAFGPWLLAGAWGAILLTITTAAIG